MSPMNAGARYYKALTLPLYDLAVLRTVVPFAWGCALAEERALYDRCVGRRHLDVGVATGYFLKHAAWPVARPDITLLDLNPNSILYAARRLRRFTVTEATGDALDPFPVAGPFDSIALFHLIHCIPGSSAEKARVLDNAAAVLAPGGTVFGASVTPAGLRTSLFASAVLGFANRLGALNNAKDNHCELKHAIDSRFRDTRVWLRGCMTLWEARNPR